MKRDRLVKRTAAPTRAGTGAAPGRPPGRPRSAAVHEAILRATIAVIREVGYDALTIEAVAARAGAGKATVYRRWSCKEELVAAAIEQVMRSIPVPDTGSLQGDLDLLVGEMIELYQEPASARMLSGLVSAMARSRRIADAVRRGFLATRRSALRQALERGRRRGELRRGADLELAIDMLSGPLLYRQLVTGGRLDRRVARQVVAITLAGLAPAPARPRRGGGAP